MTSTELSLLEKAAKGGNPVAQCELGSRHSTAVGAGLLRDDAKAQDLYRRAAESNNASAQHNYAVLLQNQGEDAAALLWYRKASNQGLVDSTYALGQLWHQGFRNENGRFVRDLVLAHDFYSTAESQGYLPALAALERLAIDMALVHIEVPKTED